MDDDTEMTEPGPGPGLGQGSEAEEMTPLLPFFLRGTTAGPDDYPLFGSWETPSTSSLAQEQIQGELATNLLFASPARRSISDRLSSGSRMDGAQDTLNVEKSRILEQLRHMTTEVDQLENRLQAVKRRRARIAASAIQKQQELQDTEAQEMRQVLGSVNRLNLSDSLRKPGADVGQTDKRAVRTPLSTLSTEAITNINVDMIRRLQSFTNIVFTSIENHTLSISEDGMKTRRYRMEGVCFQLEFNVEFTVNEPSLVLKDTRIDIPRNVQTELGRFTSRAQNESLLMPFFQTFSQYAQMDYDRQSAMNSLAKRFPRLVKSNQSISRMAKKKQSTLSAMDISSFMSPAGPGVQSMTFSGARKSSPELVFHWAIDVTDQGKLVPYVRLLPRMPKKWRQADDKATVDAIPAQFVRLLQIKGIEGAVAILLKCVFGRKATESESDEAESVGGRSS
ncbi:hypothetical protein BC939DRAFT_504790 [Gamsiella multidivaricata]|uniref:uncharacterized protein n=1 Tax=Gamsiella multidivaricata TaxID=101098 RepID=UPI002220CFE1|nr:uncharacterized protein BC939DRAFT_504790 [Gamsiella multidivaricata]KAG0371315.1 hypothetical protein BGZ54_006604 [Gamsiella multidivaricata]KAI7820819.1 hypothetical protein BC939DRAFT_504790 [Gamsiella multidivaricata]